MGEADGNGSGTGANGTNGNGVGRGRREYCTKLGGDGSCGQEQDPYKQYPIWGQYGDGDVE